MLFRLFIYLLASVILCTFVVLFSMNSLRASFVVFCPTLHYTCVIYHSFYMLIQS